MLIPVILGVLGDVLGDVIGVVLVQGGLHIWEGNTVPVLLFEM